jgi:light-regulated signal transduction histidine kinase (bacteriophytochrome)
MAKAIESNKRLLLECEQELLHLSGAILPHGTLLVVDRAGHIRHVAENIADWLGAAPASWLGEPLPKNIAALLTSLADAPGSRLVIEAAISATPAAIQNVHGGDPKKLDLAASRNQDGGITLELIEHQTNSLPADSHSPRSSRLTSITDAASLNAAQDELVRQISQITGFQRVMLYQFREDGDGEVIAESRLDETYGSYLGLRFPGSDIPQIARALYLKNPWRLIPDATAEPIKLLSHETQPPDLTLTDLRSVSPVHRVYLANMGVRASLSFPIVIGGTLSSLVACHHSHAFYPSRQQLDHAAQLTHDFIIAMTTYQARHRTQLVDSLAHRFDHARTLLQQHGDALSAWPELGIWLMQEFNADGATLCIADAYSIAGAPLEPDALFRLDDWLTQRRGESIWTSDSLMRAIPDFPVSIKAGALAVRISLRDQRALRIYLTRLEHIHEVAWGGNPEKPVEHHDGKLGIAPRRSFEKWLEKRLGYSQLWDNESRLLALKLRELFVQEIR